MIDIVVHEWLMSGLAGYEGGLSIVKVFACTSFILLFLNNIFYFFRSDFGFF